MQASTTRLNRQNCQSLHIVVFAKAVLSIQTKISNSILLGQIYHSFNARDRKNATYCEINHNGYKFAISYKLEGSPLQSLYGNSSLSYKIPFSWENHKSRR